MPRNATNDQQMLDRRHHRTEGQKGKCSYFFGILLNAGGGKPGRPWDDEQAVGLKLLWKPEAFRPKQSGIIRQPRF